MGQSDLYAVIDVDRVDVRVGAEREGDGEIVAAVIAARRFHVERLIDADDLGFEGLGDRAFHHRGRGTRKGRRYLHLRWYDIGELRHRNACKRQGAGDRDDDRYHDGKPGTIDENR